MSLSLTPEQIDRLCRLGLNPPNFPRPTLSKGTSNTSKQIKDTPRYSPTSANFPPHTISSSLRTRVPDKRSIPIIPIISISGLTFLSFGGLILLKSKTDSTSITPKSTIHNPEPLKVPTATQVPKSIQHYLLTSQQYFTQALENQTCTGGPLCPPVTKTIELINSSLLSASEAIRLFPSDYRGYQQRGQIYQSLLGSQPQFLDTAISDFASAASLNPSSAQLTRTLASLYARQGDANRTLAYLSQTVNLEPTVAQNFYDLARLQQQTGLLSQALDTYTRLLTLISDNSQKNDILLQKDSLEHLLSQSPVIPSPSPLPSPTGSPVPPRIDAPLLQASNNSGLIIAAPAKSADISVSHLTDANALSGTAVLPANTASVTLNNENLTPGSQIYLSIISGGKNQVLQLLSRSGQSFTVGLDSPVGGEIKFSWWIIK